MSGLLPAHALARMAGIGSSDIADIVLGSGLRTYLEKTGQRVEEKSPTLQGWQPMLHGTRLEGYVCELYAEERGARLVKPDPPVIHLSGTIALASLDRRAFYPDLEIALEAKTANGHLQHEWEAAEDLPDERGVPERYVIQCTWVMGVSGLTRCDIAVLIGGQDFRIRTIYFNAERFASLLAIAEHFWRTYVVPRRMPDADGSDEWKAYLAKRYPLAGKNVLDARAEDFDNADRARRWGAIEKKATEKKETYRARLKAACGDAEGIRGVCAWTNTKKGRQLRLAKED